jgi:hypothetical protein
MLFDVPAQMKQLIGNRTELNTDTRSWLVWISLESLNQMWMFHQSEAVANALSVKDDGVIQVGVCGVIRATSVEQCLAGVEQERYDQTFGFACLLKGNELLLIEPNVIWSILRTDQIEPYHMSAW